MESADTSGSKVSIEESPEQFSEEGGLKDDRKVPTSLVPHHFEDKNRSANMRKPDPPASGRASISASTMHEISADDAHQTVSKQSQERSATEEGTPRASNIFAKERASLAKDMPSTQSVLQLFAEAITQRKKESFTAFKEWEEARATTVNQHRAICETLIQVTHFKTSTSLQGIEIIVKFFQERQRQEVAYYTAMIDKLPPLGPVFVDKTLADSTNWTLPTALKKCEQYHHQHCKNSQEIASFIESIILHGLLNDLQKDFTKRLLTLRSQVEEARKKVNTINTKLSKKTHKYNSLVSVMIAASADTQQKKQKAKDLHNKELVIVSSTRLQVQAHRELGKAVLTLINEAKKLEYHRYDGLKKAFTLYMNKMTELYGKNTSGTETLQALEHFQTENEVGSLFNLSQMLSIEEAVYIRDKKGLEADAGLTQDVVADYLENLEPQVPSTKPLVLKEWMVLRETGLLKGFKSYKIIVTVDDNMLLIDMADGNEHKKAEQIIDLNRVKWLPREGNKSKNPLVVDLEETKAGFLMDSKTKHTFKFNTEDDVDEFHYYIHDHKTAAVSTNA